MAGSSKTPDAAARIEDLHFLYASNANVSNFVTVKLSSDRNYHLWKTQILCLMETHNMGGIVDAAFVGPGTPSTEMMHRYDNLLKGWIFGSVSENVLGAVSDSVSAKEVWDKLRSFYDATISPQQSEDINSTKSKVLETYPISELTKMEEYMRVIDIGEETELSNLKPEGEDSQINETQDKNKAEKKKKLRQAIVKGDWREAESILKEDKDLLEDAIDGDGNTMLHIAVGIGGDDFVKDLILHINEEQAIIKRSSDGSTALHIAALVGNTYAAKLLVEKNKQLLEITDKKGKKPLHKAYENMHLHTIGYLFEHDNFVSLDVKIGVDILLNAISAKQYDFASKLIKKYPRFAYENDHVLMALAKTFPSGLRNSEMLIYPSLRKIGIKMRDLLINIIICLVIFPMAVLMFLFGEDTDRDLIRRNMTHFIVSALLLWPLFLICLLILIVCFPFLCVYSMLWKYAAILVPPINHIRMKRNEWKEATKVLELVCDEIDKGLIT